MVLLRKVPWMKDERWVEWNLDVGIWLSLLREIELLRWLLARLLAEPRGEREF